jgi:drug/metabolite transporter (DMT)-like permease
MEPLLRTVVSLGAAAFVVAVWAWLSRRGRPRTDLRTAVKLFLPAGACLAAAYVCLIVALDRGRVTIVAPLNATQSLWGVIFAAAFLGKREAIGPRLFAAALVVVAGGVLIGLYR